MFLDGGACLVITFPVTSCYWKTILFVYASSFLLFIIKWLKFLCCCCCLFFNYYHLLSIFSASPPFKQKREERVCAFWLIMYVNSELFVYVDNIARLFATWLKLHIWNESVKRYESLHSEREKMPNDKNGIVFWILARSLVV